VQLLNHPHPRPSPTGRGETRYSLALWERAGVRVTNLEILTPLSHWERGDKRLPRPLGEGWGEGDKS